MQNSCTVLRRGVDERYIVHLAAWATQHFKDIGKNKIDINQRDSLEERHCYWLYYMTARNVLKCYWTRAQIFRLAKSILYTKMKEQFFKKLSIKSCRTRAKNFETIDERYILHWLLAWATQHC